MRRIVAFFVAVFLAVSPYANAQERKNVTRIEFITYVMSGLGETQYDIPAGFTDLDRNDKYFSYVSAAVEKGVVKGYSNGLFRPYDDITKEEAVVILARAYQLVEASGVYINGFRDFSEIQSYATGYISAAARYGIIPYEKDEIFSPRQKITLDEMYNLTARFIKNSSEQPGFYLGYPKETDEKEFGAIGVDIKVKRAGNVYYKLLPASEHADTLSLKPHEVNEFLMAVNVVNKEITGKIFPEDDREYNLYIVCADQSGNFSDVKKITGVTRHRYQSGTGKVDDPYLIYTKEQLEGIKYYPKDAFRLDTDIELSGDWEPIRILSKGSIGFSGTFDGNFHSIKGLLINSNSKNSGLFSEIYGATIKNLYIDATIKGVDNVGIIAGTSEGSIIENCFVTGRVEAKGNNAGGIVGVNNGVIKDSVAACYIVDASNYAGGISGSNKGSIKNSISACYSVSADMYASSISGVNVGGSISKNVAASFYATDILTTKSGRITTNRQLGTTSGNYCYDKMISDNDVDFNYDSHDGLEASWEEITNPIFYRDVLGWDIENEWNDYITEDFRLITPKGFSKIDMIRGLTMYAPIKISSEEELIKVKDNIDFHYILTKDIRMKNTKNWEMIGGADGFSGTFDGNNHTISGLRIVADGTATGYGMFSKIGSGTVRNLNLKNLKIEGSSLVGGLSAENYGYIENCTVDGNIYAIRKDNMLSVGGIVANNYGIMENVGASVSIVADGEVLTAGGVVANNDGFILGSEFSGEIKAKQNTEFSNSVLGGIVGINTSGYIYDSFSDIKITSKGATNYIGGVCGILNGGEVYKSSSKGQMSVTNKTNSTSYVGGISGLMPAGLIMNCYSSAEVNVLSPTAYVGGIVGYNQDGSVQNTYSNSKLNSDGIGSFVGGIVGLSEGGFIVDNVVLDTFIDSAGKSAGIANPQSEMVYLENNYINENSHIEGADLESGGGIVVRDSEMKNEDFFFKPISDGGKLGWTMGDVWYMDQNSPYPKLVRGM